VSLIVYVNNQCVSEDKQQSRHPVTVEIAGSAPVGGVSIHGDIAQLGEHSPCKRKVVGSNPTGSIQVTLSMAASLMVKTLW
jgi:hypothetical protein